MADEFVDEFGFWGPLPLSSRQRTMPEPGFSPGLEIGEQVPDFELLDQHGETISFRTAIAGAPGKTALFFFRSAVW